MKQFSLGMAILAFVFSLSGCNMGKVRYDNTVRLETNRSYTIPFSGPAKDSQVAIEASAPESFNIEVVFDENIGKSKPLAFKSDTRSYGGTVVIPAGKPFSIILTSRSAKETQVTVRANGVE